MTASELLREAIQRDVWPEASSEAGAGRAEVLGIIDRMVRAGDAMRDDLSVLLGTEDVEATADILGLEVNAHLDEWESASA